MEEQRETARFYRVKKFTRYLGRFPDGTKIWGGPYNLTQGVVGAAAGLVAMMTNGLWGTGNIVFDLFLGGGTVYLIVRLAGRIRTGNRNPASLLVGLYTAAAAPASGSYDGAPTRLRAPRPVGGRVLMTAEPLGLGNNPEPAAPLLPEPEQPDIPAAKELVTGNPARPAVRTGPMTAVERLLAQAESK